MAVVKNALKTEWMQREQTTSGISFMQCNLPRLFVL